MTEPIQTDQLQKLLNKGFAELSRGNISVASDCCQQILKIKPDLVPGHFLIGLVALEAHDRKTAFSAFQSVVKLDKDHAAAWAHLAKLYLSEGMVNLADAALRETRRIKTQDPLVLDLIGTTLSLMGEHIAAKSFFAHANTSHPNHPPFMLNLANNLVFNGETELSKIVLEDILQIQQDSPQAHWALASSQKAKDDSHITTMEKQLDNWRDNPRALAFYLYAIGKEYEDLERWDQAFRAFSQGAAARRDSIEYDESSEIEMFDYLAKYYTKNWLESSVPASLDSINLSETGPKSNGKANTPIFILGQPRTGTTLVERIITSHSQVHSAGELQQFGLALRRLSDYQNPKRFSAELFAAAKDLDATKIGNLYLQTSRRLQGETSYFVDKLPQNYLMIPLILKALPDAKIIHLVRDPMDACFSSFKQLFADAYLHSYDQNEMARHHARYSKLMQTWRERFPGRFLEISYENVARDIEPSARQLISYLDLPWEDACLNFHQQKTAVSTASAVQVREPAHTRSIGRWKKYEQQLQPMKETLQKQHVFSD